MQIQHRPVLLQEVLQSIPQDTHFLIDGTLGHGGHTQAILDTFPAIQVLGIDRDPEIFGRTTARLEPYGSRFVGRQGSYADIDKSADYILLDIGVNMEHYKDTSRGFSTKGEAELDMRFDPTTGISAKEWIAKSSVQELQHCFVEYGDFTPEKAQEIAQALLRSRNIIPITTTLQLRQVLYGCGLGDPASRIIFQAIRIQVNGELDQLKIFLQKLPQLLNPGGRCGIISFHSIEDRIVKFAFKDLLQKGWQLLTKKPILPHYTETIANKASRSAVFRVIIHP